jgi:hypothetical protein
MSRFHGEMFCRIGKDWCGGNHHVCLDAHFLDAARLIGRIDAKSVSQKDSRSEGCAIVATVRVNCDNHSSFFLRLSVWHRLLTGQS